MTITSNDTQTVLTMRDLHVTTLDGTMVLDGVNLTLHRGEIHGLVGESGSGKTTAGLACLNHFRTGLQLADGKITVYPSASHGTGNQNNQDAPVSDHIDVLSLDGATLRNLRGSRVAYIPQDPALSLNPAMRVGEQIREVLDVHGYGTPLAGDTKNTQTLDAVRSERVAQVLRDVDLPCDVEYQQRWPHQLSGGQQQRIGIAMAFALNPDVLILDEPTTGLDVTTQAHVLTTIRRMTQQHQVASLYITHDLAVVAELADRVTVMLRGSVVEHGLRDQVLFNPEHPYTQRLLQAVPDLAGRRRLPGSVEATPTSISENSSALLEVSNVKLAYGAKKILDGVSLNLEPGQSTLLLGESGSGKTTLSRCVAGLIGNYDGEIRLNGNVLATGTRQRSLDDRQHIQYIFQSPFSSLNPRRTLGESLSVPLRMSKRLPPRQHRAVVEETLEAVQLEKSFYDRRPGDLSGGERQRAAIARALVNAPSVLVCDEITSALDVSVQASIISLLNELRAERGLALLFVTHNIALARHIADHVAVLHQGLIVDDGPVDEVLNSPQHAYTQDLLANIPQL